jgi:hypothetical protein
MSKTTKDLAEITNSGLFECLATSVLRDQSEAYSALVHCGVNAEGQTVRSPVDGISFAQANASGRQRLIAVHHTITKGRELRRKWMYDPAKEGADRSASTTPGDFVKTREIVLEERLRDPQLAATLIVTTSTDPPQDVVRELNAAARGANIDLEIWPGTRIAHYLDTTATGQWLRREYLGAEPDRLSAPLLAHLSRRSLQQFQIFDDPSLWVPRAIDAQLKSAIGAQHAVFLTAAGGLGKSVACHKLLQGYIEEGGYGLVLSEQTIDAARSLEQAIGIELRQLHPQLAKGCEDDIFAICSSTQPLLLICEDVNRSDRTQVLVERLMEWVGRLQGQKLYRLICPLKPDVIGLLRDQYRKSLRDWMLPTSALSSEEGQAAVLARATARQVTLSELDARNVSDRLGHDPLLIALHEPGGHLTKVIDDFVDTSVERLAAKDSAYSRGEFREALRIMADEMLSQRVLDPVWKDIRHRIGNNDICARLRMLLRHGEVIRIAPGIEPERIAFRHDRVRDALLIDAIAAKLKAGSDDGVLFSEPFFAEQLGAALLREGVPERSIAMFRERNPLVLFYALRNFGEPQSPFEQRIVSELTDWLKTEHGQSQQNLHLRWAAAYLMADTDSTAVRTLSFPEWSYSLAFAVFRNGSLDGGLQLCQRIEPGVTAPWFERQIAHVMTRFGANLSRAVGNLLSKTDIEPATRVAALRLAGYTADRELATAIESSWSSDEAHRVQHLADYLWAATYCCGDEAERILGPICDEWARLPDKRVGGMNSQRDNLAAEHIRWGFRAKTPVTSAIKYFIARATRDDLKFPLLYMLHSIDDPDAQEFAVRRFAETHRNGSFLFYTPGAGRQWQERPMSAPSRDRLLALWRRPEEDSAVRRNAFDLWAAAGDLNDLEILRGIGSGDEFADAALRHRLQYGDYSAISALLAKLDDPESSYHWWREAFPVWSKEISDSLRRELTRRGDLVDRAWGNQFETDLPVSELLMSIPPDDAEAMLAEHWDHVGFSGPFILSALYVGRPRLLQMVQESMRDCPVPAKMFEHLEIRYGIQTVGRPGITRRDQIEALVPYAVHFHSLTIHTLWQLCNKNGWYDLRRQYFDELIDRKYRRLFLDNAEIAARFDELIEKRIPHWIDVEVDEWLQTGATLDEIVAFLSGWLADRMTIQALGLVASALRHAGMRRHLAILDREIEPRDVAEKIRLDTAFCVYRRTLQ